MIKSAVVMVWIALLAADRYLDVAQKPHEGLAAQQQED